MAACLSITGHEDWARQVLGHFSWGDAFFEVNRELLDIYAACGDAQDIAREQEAWMDKLEQEYQARRRGTDDTAGGGGGDGDDDVWASGNANHTVEDRAEESGARPASPADSQDSSTREDDSLWTTDRLGNRVRVES